MSLSLGIVERLNRARGDLRMGVPVVLTEEGAGAVAVAVEALEPGRLADLRLLGEPVLAITARRAETLKARVYDDDLARIELPDAAGIEWLRAVADPADDLRLPMKGPLRACGAAGRALPARRWRSRNRPISCRPRCSFRWPIRCASRRSTR